MSKICYDPKARDRLAKNPERLKVLAHARSILDNYATQGLDLTLRQLYYRFVAGGLIPNRQQEYKKLGDIIAQGRLAGLIDWDHIVDRTRNLRELPHYRDPAHAIQEWKRRYWVDRWEGQPRRVEVWIEKDALVGVIQRICREYDVPFFSCRGYTSLSEVWSAGQRMTGYIDNGQHPVVIHLGDHDPSGIDMSRDISSRLFTFIGSEIAGQYGGTISYSQFRERFTLDRIALNMDQIDQYNPPPNPAKLTDSRSTDYISNYGSDSWELDALEPNVIVDLIRNAIEDNIEDEDAWQRQADLEAKHDRMLAEIARRWDEVEALLDGGDDE